MPYIADGESKISNRELVDAIAAKYPNIAGQSSKVAYNLLTTAGFEEMVQFDPQYVSEFFGLMMRVWLQIVNISHAKDPLEEADFGEYFDQPYGGVIQRMSVSSVKPVSPGWVGLKNGDSPDPFVVRKPITNERFYKQNFDYQSLITVPDQFQLKQIFVSPFGMEEFMAAIMVGLENGWIIQKWTMKMEAINASINSTNFPLQGTQKVGVEFAPAPTEENYKELILTIRNVVDAMISAPQIGAFNQAGFESTQDKSRLRLLIRQGLPNEIAVNVLSAAFNADELNLGIKVVKVPNFGGLKPFSDAEFTTALYPVYDKLGTQIGWNTVEGSEEVTVQDDAVFWQDPNADVLAIIADKGLVFESRQNPYTVEPIRNPRGLYTNFWASSPNNAIHYDRYYNMVVIKAVAPAEAAALAVNEEGEE